MSDTDAAEANRRAEWLHKHKAPKDWIVLTTSEVSVIREELLAVERERDEAQERECAAIESWWEEHQRALREGQRVVEAREQNAKLRYIAKRAIEAIPFTEGYGEFSYAAAVLRAELEQIEEGAK